MPPLHNADKAFLQTITQSPILRPLTPLNRLQGSQMLAVSVGVSSAWNV